MYKVVIIDDEKKICNLIVTLGNWQRYDMQVVDVCYDGEEGLNSIRTHLPDLVLTDVRMPVYDGLELVRQAAELNIPSSFVIISGYKYFEYAYSAFKYGVIDYLLKPIEQDQLNEVLKKVYDMLEARRRQNSTEYQLKQIHEDLAQNRRRQAFQDLFSGAEVDKAAVGEIFPDPDRPGVWQAFFLKTGRDLQKADNQPLADKISLQAQRIFQDVAELCTDTVS